MLLQVLKEGLFKWVSIVSTSKTLETQFRFFLLTLLPSLLHILSQFQVWVSLFLADLSAKILHLTESHISNYFPGSLVGGSPHHCTLHVMLLGSSCPNCHASRQFSLLLFFSISCFALFYYLFAFFFLIYLSFYLNAVTTWGVEDPFVNDLNTAMFSTMFADNSLCSLTL